MRCGSHSARAILICFAVLASPLASFAQKAGVITKFVAPASFIQLPTRPGLQAVEIPVAQNAQVKWKDVLRTGEGGRLRVQLNDSSILSLGSKSQLTVTQH